MTMRSVRVGKRSRPRSWPIGFASDLAPGRGPGGGGTLPNRRGERIDDKPHPFDDKARILHVAKSDNPGAWKRAYQLHFGLPGSHIMPFDRDICTDFVRNILHGRESTIFEPEWSFLVRHGLLVNEDST